MLAQPYGVPAYGASAAAAQSNEQDRSGIQGPLVSLARAAYLHEAVEVPILERVHLQTLRAAVCDDKVVRGRRELAPTVAGDDGCDTDTLGATRYVDVDRSIRIVRLSAKALAIVGVDYRNHRGGLPGRRARIVHSGGGSTRANTIHSSRGRAQTKSNVERA